MTFSRKRWRRAVLSFCALVLGAATAFGALMTWLDFYGQNDRTVPCDAIIVLGSRVREGGLASNSLRRRALHAANLYRRGVAKNIVCTGGVGDNAPAESQVAAQILRENGVPDSAILGETVSHSTWENAAEAAHICKNRGWKRVVIVSEPYHLWRACRNFRAFGLQAFGSPASNPPPRTRLQMAARECLSVTRDFWQRR